MPLDIQRTKLALRAQVRQILARLPDPTRTAASAEACSLLLTQKAWTQAKSVLFYAPLPGELDIWPLVAMAISTGKSVALPRFDPAKNLYAARELHDPQADLEIGRFGIREPTSRCVPIPLNKLDLILVPGVAFDLHGRRLGRGRGFYDLLLAVVRGQTCGVAFDEQLVAEVPVEPHDVSVKCILTPTRWLEQ